MEVISRQHFMRHKQRYCRKIAEGAVFIYPTDTIYGIGCDAANNNAVKRVRKIKQRLQQPFSVAVPSKGWILKNCSVSAAARRWLKKLPGPYTLLLKLKRKKEVAATVIPKTNIIGVRIPNNWFSKIVAELNIPIVSTSANITKKKHMTSLKDLNPEVARKVDFIIYEGKKKGRPSKIVKTHSNKVEIMQR